MSHTVCIKLGQAISWLSTCTSSLTTVELLLKDLPEHRHLVNEET